MGTVEKGLYRHFKGGIYEVLFIAINTENSKHVVVYEKNSIKYTRPLSEWCDIMENGQRRFTKIEDEISYIQH